MKNTNKKGFTLVELVIVIAVIAILAGVLIGTFASVIKRANQSAEVQNIKNAEIAQKADDIIKKIEEANWFGWEDFEAEIVSAVAKAVKENSTPYVQLNSNEIKAVVEDAVKTALANIEAQNTYLTKEDVKAVVENALGTLKYEGVTEAQVRAIVNGATTTLLGNQLTAAQVRSIVNAANEQNLTAIQLANALASAMKEVTTVTDLTTAVGNIQTIVTNATSTLATSEQVQAIKEAVDQLVVNTTESDAVVLAKSYNILITKYGVTNSNSKTPYDVLYKATITNVEDSDTNAMILLSLENARFIVVEKSTKKVVYNGGLQLTIGSVLENEYKYWTFEKETSTTATYDEFSVYLLDGSSVETVTLTGVGVDIGNATVPTINYGSAGETHKVVIRTNGGTLTVGTQEQPAAGKITHYGSLEEAIVYTTNNSFHTHGKIACMDLKAGKAVAEDKGYVALVKAASDTEIQEVDTGVFYIPTNAVVADIDTIVAASIGYVSDGDSYVVDTTTEAGQKRTQTLASTAYEIGSKFDLIAFRDAVNNGQDFSQIKVVLTDNIDMLGYPWTTPIGLDNMRFEGKFDGKGHTISNLSNNGLASTEILVNNTSGNEGSVFGLFGFVKGDVEISNLTISVNAYCASSSNGWGSVVAVANSKSGKQPANKLTLKNITVSGILNGMDKTGGLVGDASASLIDITFENCNNYANITGDRAGGMVCSIANASVAKFTNCHNYGNITSSKTQYGVVAGMTPQNSGNTSFVNCTNEFNEQKNQGKLDGFVAYDLATYVFVKFTSTGNYNGCTSTYHAPTLLDWYTNRFAGKAVTPLDWKYLETHNNESIDGGTDYTGLFAGITYDLNKTYNVVTSETYNNTTYSRKFDTLDEALSHKIRDGATITLNSNQTLSYTLQQGYGGSNLWTHDVSASGLTFELENNTITTSLPLLHTQGSYTFKNGTINYTGNDLFANMNISSQLVLSNVTLNGGKIQIEPESNGTNVSKLIFDGNSTVNCYFDLGGTSTTSVKINDVTYSQANGRYVIISNNVVSQSNNL